MPEGISFRSNPLAFGAQLSGSRQLPVGQRTFLVPELALRSELTSPPREASWRRWSVTAGASLLFDITPSSPPAPPPSPRPVVEAQPAPHVPYLAASVTLQGIDIDGSMRRETIVHTSEVRYRKYTPLLPLFFFDHDSASLSSRYLQQKGGERGSFAPDLLRDMSALDVHRYNLSLLGYKLRRYPGATLTLIGSVSQDEPATLARRRAEEVRRYLHDSWGIDLSRMTVQEGEGRMARSSDAIEDGRAENRRVEFVSNMPEITEPIASDRIVRDFNPPAIVVDPKIEAEAGIRRWSIAVSGGDRGIAYYASDDTTTGGSPPYRLLLPEERFDATASAINAELTVVDSTGATVLAHDELPVIVDRKVQVVEQRGSGSADRISYALLAFDFNSAEPGAGQRASLREIVGTIDSTQRVRVTGYTDRIGSEGFNVDLSRRRAERVAAIIRAMLDAGMMMNVPVTSEAGGIESARFGNDTPEGRILSRGVLVVIERKPG
jgi:outer membrane protein OmpA-like peptidoglycan-associated protein